MKHLQNTETEAGLLGALLSNNRQVERVLDLVGAEDFADYFHSLIFTDIVAGVSAGKQVSPVTLSPLYKGVEALNPWAGDSYLAKLTSSVEVMLLDVRQAAKDIRDLAIRRRIIAGLEQAKEMAGDVRATQADIISTADAALSEAMRSTDGIEQSNAGEAFRAMLAAYDEPKSGVTCHQIPTVDALLGPIRKKELVIMAGRPGMGKAQPLDSRVLTPEGWVNMGNLQVGDDLASIDGGTSKVVGIYPQGIKQIYRVTLSDGRSAECCAEHLWKVEYRDWLEARTLSTEQIMQMLAKKRYKGRISINRISGDWGAEIDYPVDPWLLGFLIGDGNLRQDGVRFSTADAEIVDRVREAVGGLIVTHISAYDYGITAGVRGSKKPNTLLNHLRSLGLSPSRSHSKFIPERYLIGSKSQRLNLLRGLMDSDGWVEKQGAIRFSTASERLAEDVCKLVRSLGGLCSYRARQVSYTYKGEKRDGRPAYTCRIRMDQPELAFSLDRKIKRCGRIKNTVRLNVTSIEPTRMAQAQCIEVSHPSRLYITDEFTVTHNTAVALSYGVGAARSGFNGMFVSLEMSADQLMQRAAADVCFDSDHPIPYNVIRDGSFESQNAKRRVWEATRLFDTLPLEIVDAGMLTVGRLNMLVQRHKRKLEALGQTLDFVIVDYLQLLHPDRRGLSRYEQVTEVSMMLKAIAKMHDVSIIALAQLSREVEKRQDKRPVLSDLRDSGQIEQDADSIIFLYREAYYLQAALPKETDPSYDTLKSALDAVKYDIEIIAAKRRSGETGSGIAQFHGHYQAVRG